MDKIRKLLNRETILYIIFGVATTVVNYAVFHLLYNVMDGIRLETLGAIIAAVIVYAIMIFVTKTITKEELAKMPIGNKIVKVLDKFIK